MSTELETIPPEIVIRRNTLEQFKKKFMQVFSNQGNSLIGANKIPIEVLIVALTKDLHILRHDIPPQGDQEADLRVSGSVDFSR